MGDARSLISQGILSEMGSRTSHHATRLFRSPRDPREGLRVGCDIGTLRFDGEIEIEGAGAGPFSRPGDSGSLVVDDQRLAVAQVFAGGDFGGSNGQGVTYASPIARVLEALGVEIALL